MPLARLSIKSALSLAQGSVTIRPSPSGPWWVVSVKHSARKTVLTGEWSKADAQRKKRERRIFVALLLLGFDEGLADKLARAANDDGRDWRQLVSVHVERRELSRT